MGSPRTDARSFAHRRKTHADPNDPIGVSVELLDDLNAFSLHHTSSKKSLHSNGKNKSYVPPNQINRNKHSHRAGSNLLPPNAPKNSTLLGPLQSP